MVGIGLGHIVLDAVPPQFSAQVYCGQAAGWIKMALGMEVGLGPGHIVVDGDPAPFPKKDIAPNFRSIAIVVKRHGCIKMPLGMEIGLSPGDFVLDGGPAPLPKGGGRPNFRFMSIVAKRRWMDQGATWYGGRPRPRRHCVRRGPSCPAKMAQQPSSFRRMSIVATVAHLSYC